MRGGIAFCHGAVTRAHDHLAPAHDHAADRHLAARLRGAGFLQGHIHECGHA
jgi:hypothetical protein